MNKSSCYFVGSGNSKKRLLRVQIHRTCRYLRDVLDLGIAALLLVSLYKQLFRR